jgi:hypothetical protein
MTLCSSAPAPAFRPRRALIAGTTKASEAILYGDGSKQFVKADAARKSKEPLSTRPGRLKENSHATGGASRTP